MRISQGFKDWRRMQDIRDMENRKKIEAINCEQLRIDAKAQRLAGINKKMKDATDTEEYMRKAKAREEMELRVYKLAQQEELAAQLANIKVEEFKELKLRQQLRESSQELRELEAKLRTAYVSKDLAAQIREKQLKRKLHKLEEEKVLEVMNKVEQEQREEDAKKMQEEHLRKLNYRHDLQEQMRDSIAKREEAFQQFLQDKLLLDDITRIIHEEDMREEELKMLNKKRTKEEMDEFNRARQIWREREKAVIEEEDRRLIEYWVRKNAEAEELALKEKCDKEALERRQKIIMDYILEAKKKKEMEREALEQLVMEEHALKEEERLQNEMETALRERIQLKCIYEKQKRERMEQLQREAELDEQYRQQMLMKFAEDERIEQMTKERRRQKILDHRKQVEEMILDRQRKRSEEIQALKVIKELEDRQIELRHKMVEEERLRLLQEHAKHLLGYLPKGVLRPNDLPHIGSALIEVGNK